MIRILNLCVVVLVFVVIVVLGIVMVVNIIIFSGEVIDQICQVVVNGFIDFMVIFDSVLVSVFDGVVGCSVGEIVFIL